MRLRSDLWHDVIHSIGQINHLHNVHNYGGGLSIQKHSRASKKWVSSIDQEKIVDAPLYRPKDIKKEIFREYGLELSYQQAWLGKEYKLDGIHMKDKYHSKLLVVITLNGQNELFSLAYVACDLENEEKKQFLYIDK
ncbi:hypothetical protein Taro_026122, partial [Colocasia esculenta]|nr:hypothetical protein [Colocasia esculenta]